MVYAVVLAGGTGTRIRSSDIPKQFLEIGGKAILLHTLDKFLACKEFVKIVIAAPEAWIDYTKELLNTPKYADIAVCTGGKNRQESLYNAVCYIDKNYPITDKSIVISHDAARPFVSIRIIRENIEFMKKYDAVDTAIPCTDTIVTSHDGEHATSIPDRKRLYQGQTPQSFFLKQFKEIYANADKAYIESVTDAIRILIDGKCNVGIVHGEQFNIKITNDFDLQFARYLTRDSHD